MKWDSNIYKRYWHHYGCWGALVKSPYLWTAFCFSLLAYPLWTSEGWWDTSLSVLPNIIGFSLGCYAILLALGDENFRALLSGAKVGADAVDDKCDPTLRESPFMGINAHFVHTILVQMVAIFFALLAKARLIGSLPEELKELVLEFLQKNDLLLLINVLKSGFWFIGVWAFLYALLVAVSITMTIFRLASWYDIYKTNSKLRAESGAQASDCSCKLVRVPHPDTAK